jgi:hypothetical protein
VNAEGIAKGEVKTPLFAFQKNSSKAKVVPHAWASAFLRVLEKLATLK